MNGSQRFVADTNVLVSFILRPDSTPGNAVTRALDRSLIVFSDVTFAELSSVLKRPKFDPYVPWQRRQSVLRLLADAACCTERTYPSVLRPSGRSDPRSSDRRRR